MSKIDPNKLISTGIRLPEDLWLKVKNRAFHQHRTFNSLVIMIVDEHFNKPEAVKLFQIQNEMLARIEAWIKGVIPSNYKEPALNDQSDLFMD